MHDVQIKRIQRAGPSSVRAASVVDNKARTDPAHGARLINTPLDTLVANFFDSPSLLEGPNCANRTYSSRNSSTLPSHQGGLQGF